MKNILKIILVIILFYFLYFTFLIPTESEEIEIRLNVENVLGFNINNTGLFFGTIPPGATGSKNITFNNELQIPQFIHISTSGDVSEWVKVSQNNFFIMPNEEKIIKIKIFVPESSQNGEYKGILKIDFKKII